MTTTTKPRYWQWMGRADAAWLHMEDPTNLMMITGLFQFKRALDRDRFRQVVEQRLLSFDRFKMKVGYPKIGVGRPLWKMDRKLDLDRHLDFRTLAAPGTEEQLLQLVSELMSTPLERDRPLWQFHIVEGLGGGGGALIARLHHAIADGIALTKVLLSLTESEGDDLLEAPQRRTAALANPSADIKVKPRKFVELAKDYGGAASDLGKLLLESEPPSPFKGRLGVPKTAACTQPIPLQAVKDARQRSGCTVNDVLMAAVAGGLRRHYERIVGDAPKDGFCLNAVIPVDLRRPGKEQPLGNRFGLVFLGLPLGTECPRRRLAEVQQRMNALKHSPQAVVVLGLLSAVGSIPAELQKHVVEIFGSKATAVVSNVPGPRSQLKLAGEPIQSLMFWVPQSGRLGVGLSVLSYDGQVRIGVATDAGLPIDAPLLAQDIETAVMELIGLPVG
jgi:diacylglycerol O-acyltransferase / wax synthase